MFGKIILEFIPILHHTGNLFIFMYIFNLDLQVGQDLMRPFGLDDDDFELSYILDRNIVTSFTIVDSLQDDDPRMFTFKILISKFGIC